MSKDKQMVDTNSQAPDSAPQPPVQSRLWRWLSTGLIVAGLLLLGAGGLMTYLNLATLADPPSPVGQVDPPPSVGLAEPTFPPSLEENPLPVLTDVTYSGSTPMPLPTPITEPLSTLELGSPEAMREAERDVPSGPPPTSTPAPVPPATNPPARIVIPAIDLDAKVVPIGWKQVNRWGGTFTVWEVVGYAAGWHRNSSLPGHGGNVVLSGHHNIKGEVFRYIVDLNPGDAVTLYADERPYTYTVEARFVVRDKGEPEEKRQKNARWIGPFPDERVTLVTCWPYTNNTHRVIVIAKPTG